MSHDYVGTVCTYIIRTYIYEKYSSYEGWGQVTNTAQG